MSRSPLFGNAREDFSMDHCANCGAYLSGVKLRVKIEDREVLVCSFGCEQELKANIKEITMSKNLLADIENLIVATTPGGIEAQEAKGQQQFVNSATLPLKFNSGTRRELETMGVKYLERPGDPAALFCPVNLPSGWKVEPTDHSMWSKLIDDKGRERASIFYKAAFYDRDAFVNVNRRFGVSRYEACDAEGVPIAYPNPHTHFATVIKDGGKPIRLIGIREDSDAGRDRSDRHHEEAEAWLNENYPDWQNRTAYWD